MTDLSDHFTLEEMTATSTGLSNEPTDAEVMSLTYLCTSILEPIRAKWGAIKVDCGYRSPAVNAKVGGKANSQHLLGEAADIVPFNIDMNTVFEWIVYDSGLKFGQAIRERRGASNWIHISLPRVGKPNQEALVSHDGKTYFKYEG